MTDPSRTRPSDRLIGIVLGAVLVLAAIAVAIFAGRGGGTASVATGPGARTIAVTLEDMRITPSVLTVPSGTRLTLQVHNADAMSHDLAIDGGPSTPLLAPGRDAAAPEARWQSRLGRIRLGAEPVEQQVARYRRATWALTIVCSVIALMFLALFTAFRAPLYGLALDLILLAPVVALAWIGQLRLERGAGRYLEQRGGRA